MTKVTLFLLAAFLGAAEVSAQDFTARYAREQLAERGFVKSNALLQEDFIAQCAAGNLENVKLFLMAGADPNAVGHFGRPALLAVVDQNHTMIHEAHREVLETLIQAGADLDVRDAAGRTAFVIASTRKNLDLLEVLLEAKASDR